MRHLNLFSGIGGFALAASWVWAQNHEVVAFCEQDQRCQCVLAKHWPDIPIHADIKGFRQQNELSMHRGYDYGNIDLLTGGFPCQPYSIAGHKRGSEDDRALWPEMLRVIKETKPRWIIGENVDHFINMEFDDCVSNLEAQGYETTAFNIPACSVGADHRRYRVWIVANTCKERLEKLGTQKREMEDWGLDRFFVRNHRREGWNPSSAFIRRGVHGIPGRVDRIKGLGNAIVPQVVMVIMAAIKQIEQSI